MFRNSLFAFLTLTALLVSGAASADFDADTLVKDDVDIWVDVDDVETRAYDHSYAETTIGTIDDGAKIDGEVNIKVYADDVYTEAKNHSTACTAIGSVGGCQDRYERFGGERKER